MSNRSNEIVKQLNRLANDRNLPMNARKKINDAARHIRDLQSQLQEATTKGDTELVDA